MSTPWKQQATLDIYDIKTQGHNFAETNGHNGHNGAPIAYARHFGRITSGGEGSLITPDFDPATNPEFPGASDRAAAEGTDPDELSDLQGPA